MMMRKQFLAVTIGVLLALSLLSVLKFSPFSIKPVQATTLFSDSFNSGTFASWDGESTSAGCSQFANDGIIYKTGPYGANATLDGDTWFDYAFQYKDIDTAPLDLASVNVRAYFRWTANPSSNNTGYHKILELRTYNSTGDWDTNFFVLQVQNIANNARWQIEYRKNGGIAVLNSSSNLSVATWYCAEVHIDVGDSTGNVTLWVDNVNTLADAGFDNLVDGKYIYRMRIGMTTNYKDAVTVFWDEVVVSDAYIGEISADSTSPTFGAINANTTIAGDPCQLSCVITDNVAVNSYTVSTNNTGPWVNATTEIVSGSPVTATWNSTWNATAGYVVSAKIYSNDTSNNNSTSTQYNFTLTSAGGVYVAQDIQDLIDAAAENDTVELPFGTYTFNGDRINITKPITLDGNDSTLQSTLNGAFGTMIYVTGTPKVNITNLNMIGNVTGDDDVTGSGITMLDSLDFHIGHCNFTDFPNAAIWAIGQTGSHGLIDYSRIDDPYKETVGGSWGYGIGITSNDYWDWDSNITHFLGQYDTVNSSWPCVYIENNFINRTRHAISSNQRGWYVVRYNTLSQINNNYIIDVHSPSTTAAGGRGVEVYNNTIDAGNAQNSYGIGMRGGSGVIYNNTIRNLTTGIRVTKDGLSGTPFRPLNDLWIWDNTFENVPTHFQNYDGYYIENTDYFLRAPTLGQDGFIYSAYPYPHWLAGTTSTVTVTVTYPQNTTYTIPATVLFTASGGTISQYWYNAKNGTNWVYATNQTGNSGSFAGFGIGYYVGYFWANNTDGSVGVATVGFSISVTLETLIVSTWWSSWW